MAKDKGICAVPSCGKPVHIALRGWCRSHYARWLNYGNHLGTGSKQAKSAFGAPRDFLERALEFNGEECLEWPFAKDTGGYGVIKVDGRLRNAHREICRLAHGVAPTPDHEAAHDFNGLPCASNACINPAHLRWATRSENEQDKARHRSKRGADPVRRAA